MGDALGALLVMSVASASRNATFLPAEEEEENDDDGGFRLTFENYIIGVIGLATAIVAPYAFVVGLPGITAECPIDYPKPHWCCGCGRRWPCHWRPAKLCAANCLAALASGVLAGASALYAVHFNNWFLGVVGAAVNGAFFLLCAVAAKRLYEPRYKLKRILRAVFQDDTLFTDL
mmetsp:Transcript_8152/g.26739  ORF Transcript_8152/g.26739 Transcript_8152/m.26739 type:complete len:175 (+) Transcript_8152:82-606(+)